MQCCFCFPRLSKYPSQNKTKNVFKKCRSVDRAERSSRKKKKKKILQNFWWTCCSYILNTSLFLKGDNHKRGGIARVRLASEALSERIITQGRTITSPQKQGPGLQFMEMKIRVEYWKILAFVLISVSYWLYWE